MHTRMWWVCALVAAVALVLSPGAPGADAARVLVVMAMPAPSHLIVFTALTRALADRGHHITLVTPMDKSSKLLPTHNHYVVSVKNQEVDDYKRKSMERIMTGTDANFIQSMIQFFKWGPQLIRNVLQHPDFKAEVLDKPGQKFDLVITETFFLQEALVALGHKFQVPVVALNPFGTSPQMDDIMGNPVNPAWVPNVFLGLPDRMSFVERIASTGAAVGMRLMYWYYQLPMHQEIVSEFFPDAPPLLEMLQTRLALTLINNHHTLNYPVPLAPGVVEVGGIQIKEQASPLPPDLKQLMDSAKEGVVYFSMGSNLQMEFLSKEKMLAIFNALGSLKQRVLLKWDGPVPDKVSKNIHIIAWAPQADILAHPNLRLFVTHGGLLSTQESVYHAVPLVAIPVFADQDTNMRMAAKKGFCVQVPFADLTEDKLTAAFKEVLSKPSYKEAASRLSRLFRSKPIKSSELAVFWVEHVMQHGGAHLRPACANMPLYQLLLLDVLAAFLVPLVLVVLLLRALCRRCCRGSGQRPASATRQQKKKNN